MATQRLAKVVITANASTAKKVLEEIDALVQRYTADIQKMTAAGQANTAECKQAERTLKALSQVQRDNIEDTKRLGEVVQDLTNTKLRDLRRALGSGKAALAKLTGSDADLKRAEQIRSEMKQVGDQMRLIEGQYVKIADGLKNVKNQSDQWLDKAIKQQRDLVGSLQKSDASYQQNLATLKQLEAEEDRRKGKMSKLEALQTVNNSNASASDLRRAKATLTEARDNTPTKYSDSIGDYNRELQEIEKRLEAVSGKAQKASMSWKQMKQILAEPNKASGEDIKRTMEVIAQKIQQLPAGSKYVADLRRQYSMLEQTLKGTRMSQMALNDILTRSKQGKASLDELRRAYKQLEDELNQINTKSKEFAEKQKSMKELKKNIDEVTGAANKQGGAWQTALKNLTAYVGLFSLFNKAKELVTGAIKKNLEYSGSLTDIRKVSGLTMDQVKQLSTELAKIDTRTSVDSLAQLAYQGAKLGMGKYGVEGMAQFVKAADKINVAIGEEMGEEALPALSKMVEVMGLIPKMGIDKAMEATGSAMFKLSSTSTSTSNDIVEFSKRLTGVARTAGITTDQLLALGSASSSMMLMPEVASTAMGKFIVALQKNHNIIAKELGIPDETIKNLYASGHAMDAIVLVLEKMRDKGNMNALGGIFKDLGSDGQRLVTAMVTMSKNVDMLKDHLYESKEAFDEATAVTNEYEMQQQSAIGILERANNLWEKAFVNPDGVDAVKSMAEWWYEMSKTMTNSPLLKGTLLTALQMVLMTLKAVATLLPVIIGYMASQGIYSGLVLIKNFGIALGSAVKQMYAYATASRTAAVAQTGLNSAIKLNPWVALASIVVAVAGAVYGYAQQAKEAAKAEMEAAKKANEWKNNLREAQSETDTTTRKLHSYKVAMEKLNLSQTERSRQISQFNRDFRPYISKLGIEIKSVDDLRKNYKALAEEIQRATYYRLREKAKEDAMPKFQMDRLNAENRIKNALKMFQSRGSGFTSKGIMEMFARGANANWIYRQIIKGDRTNVDDKGINFEGTTGRYSYTTKSGATISGSNQELLSALRHYQNATSRERNKDKEINDYFGDFVREDYHPWIDEEVGTLDKDAPNKDAIAQEKRDKRDRERAWREELKQKQDEANAIMDNVRNFYERQINAKMEQAIQLGMDKSEQDLFVEPVKQRMNQALEQVRLAIAGQANTWEQFKLTMKDDLIEQTDKTGVNLSEGLLKGITSNNIDALRKKLNELGNSLNRPLNSILAEVFAKATKNAQDNLKLATKQQEARRKAIQEHDYTGVVQQSSYDNFNILGYANPTEAEIKDKAAFDKRKANIIAMFEKARTNITKVFSYDMSKEEDRGLLLKLLFGDDFDGMGKRIAETLGSSAEEWQAFYQKLIQYNDEYESANKKGDDERKKLNDYGWSKTDYYKDYQNALPGAEQEVAIKGSYRNVGQRMGMESVSASDPELKLLKARMEFAQRYYTFLEEHNATEQQLADARKSIMAEQANYAKKLTGDMFEQYNSLLTFMGPLQTFGESVGDAFATITENAAEGRKALKTALKQMIKSFATNTLQMISQQQIDRAQTTAHYTQLLLMQQAFGTAKVEGEAATGVALLTAKMVNNQTEEQLEVAHQEVMAALRSAGIFGWCVSTLGPIAGPIAYSAMMAILMGLLNFAISKVGGSDKSKNEAVKGKNTKVVSGMLTYDSGNVQDLRPFVGNDGSLYWATEDSKPHNGVSLLTQPTATTINGHPSLVAENGPELVIGRETTQAMMMNNPQLLKALVNYDRNYSGRRAYDTGNIAETSPTVAAGASVSDEMVSYQASTNVALLQAVNTLLQRLEQPIEAKIDMYGRGKLYDSMTRANQFMKNK